jgi:L-2-hydroxyglutarate oxidase
MTSRVIIVGGGLVGLSTAYHLCRSQRFQEVIVLEKEDAVSEHQSGRNSGVIHSGIYYRPGSLKSEFCKGGRAQLIEFADHHQITYDICGKVIVAQSESDIPELDRIWRLGLEHRLTVKKLDHDELRFYEPHVGSPVGIRVEETGVIDFPAVAVALQDEIHLNGGSVMCGNEVLAGRRHGRMWHVTTNQNELTADVIVNCAGLQSDTVAETLIQNKSDIQILPFRGEYFDVVGQSAELVQGLIYPVPNSKYPFLGVHLTRGVNGSVHAGPNAVLALSREGYSWSKISIREVNRLIRYKGTWKLAASNFSTGSYELARSLSKRLFVRDLRKLVPEIRSEDVVKSTAGVRAQAINKSGQLLDDFHIIKHDALINVINAPSPGATSCLAIGKYVSNLAIDFK